MTVQRSHPFWGIKPEELYEARLRAHAERAKVMRQLFAALVSWRRNATDLPAREEPVPTPAPLTLIENATRPDVGRYGTLWGTR
jgi:hypothetical protein